MKYWIYRDTRILGPFGRDELERMDGIGPGTLVCPESELGHNDGDWRSLGETMGGPSQSSSSPPPSPAFPEGEEYNRDWVSSFYYRDAPGAEPSLLDLPGPEEFAQSRVRVVELEEQLHRLMDRVGELEAEQGDLLRQLWKINRGEFGERAAPSAPLPQARRTPAAAPPPPPPPPQVEAPPPVEGPPLVQTAPAAEEMPVPAPEAGPVSHPPAEPPAIPEIEIPPAPVEAAPAAVPEPGRGGIHLKITRPKPRQLKFKPTKTLPRAEGSPVPAFPPAPLSPAPIDAGSIEVRVPEAPPPVPLPLPVEAPSFPPMPVIQAPPPPPPTPVPPPMPAVQAPAPTPVLQAPSEPPAFPPMPALGSSEPTPPPALSQPALPPLTMTFSAGPKAEVPAPMMAPVPQISPTPQPALTPVPANPPSRPAPPTGGADPGAMTGGADVVARLAKGRDKNETAPPQPKRRPSKALYVMALFGIVAVLFIAWVAKDRKALRTMMSMGKDQPAIGDEIAEEEPPVQKAPSSVPPAAPPAPAPAAVPADPESEEPIPTAINLTKEYPLDGDRGSIGQWLQYSFSTGGTEEWSAGAVDSQTYLVTYKVAPQGGASGRAPITYLFETDIVKKTVKGQNPDSKQLLSGGGGAESAKPAAVKPAAAKPVKAAPKARRKTAAKPAPRAAPAPGPEAAGPMIEDGELAPPAEEDSQP